MFVSFVRGTVELSTNPFVSKVVLESFFVMTPFSVIMAVIRFAIVTSNTGFQTEIPDGATCCPWPPKT